MKKCNKCNVFVNTYKKTCPLCGEILENDNETLEVVPYPNYKVQVKKKNVALKVISFLLIVASLASVVINYYTFSYNHIPWSAIIVYSSLYTWLFLKHTILSKHTLAKRFVVLSIATSILFMVIDIASSNDYNLSWSIDFMLPFIMMASTFTILFILFIKKIKYKSYLLHLIASIMLGFIPFILMLLNITQINWPSIASGCVSLFTLIGIFIFADDQTKNELKKRLHI